MLQPIYQILGKDKWVNGRYKFEPELMIRRLGKEAFDDKIVESKHVEVKDFMELISAIVAVNYFRSGYQELPAELPKTLFSYSDDEKLEKLGSYMEFFAWFIKQFDGLLGQWPIEIEIEDIDPTQAGDQTKKVQLPNISETLAELYGLLVDNTVNSDIAVSFLMRLSSEVIATKNSSLITQDYAKANADYLGYKGNPIKREINYAFNPSELDSLEKILSETTKKIIGWENQDKETVANYLQKLMFAAQIIKTVFYRTGSQEGLQELIQRLTKPDDVATDAEWERFMSRINNPQSEFNFGNNPEPKIRDKPGPTA